MSSSRMAEYWDAKAREKAAYFVDNELDYESPDLEAFWAKGPVTLDMIRELTGAPDVGPEDVVVEIGCGIGRFTRPLAERGGRVYALDVSEQMIARAREHNPSLAGVEWIVGDGTTLAPVPDGAASVVFSHVVFQHIPDPQITLGYVREMGRVLRQGGWALFQISNDPSIHRAHDEGLGVKLRKLTGKAPKGMDDPAWLGSAVDLGDLNAAAAEGGLAVERLSGEGTQFCFVLLRKS